MLLLDSLKLLLYPKHWAILNPGSFLTKTKLFIKNLGFYLFPNISQVCANIKLPKLLD